MNQSRSNRILIVDDNPAIHDDIKKILCGASKDVTALHHDMASLFGEVNAAENSRRREFEIDSAFQGQRALAMLIQAREERPYALAFVDIRMPPGWDGAETLNRLWEADPNLQVVMCTAYSDYSWDDLVEKVGSSDNMVILKKPFDNIEVLQLAHALTEKWHLAHTLQNYFRDLDEGGHLREQEMALIISELRKENQRLLQALSNELKKNTGADRQIELNTR